MESNREMTKNTKQKQPKKRQIPIEKTVIVSLCDSTLDETILDYEVVFDKKSE